MCMNAARVSGSLLLLHTICVCSADYLAAVAVDIRYIYKVQTFLGF